MWSPTKVFVLTSFIVACNAVTHFMPSDKELIYNYQAMVNIGTYEPSTFASQFILEGKLHLQKDNSKTIAMRFSDMTYKLYNGKMDNFHEQHHLIAFPLPEDTDDILKPFFLRYIDSQLTAVITDKTDKQFSRDIKKAIGLLLQLDVENEKLNEAKPCSFYRLEHSIYDKKKCRYVLHPDDDKVTVTKFVGPSENTVSKLFATVMNMDGMMNYLQRHPVSQSSVRKYILVKDETNYHIKTINSQSSTYVQYMKGLSESQFMLINQTMTLKNTIPIAEKITMPEEINEEYPHFSITIPQDHEGFVDLTGGKIESNMTDSEDFVYELLKKDVGQMKINRLTIDSPKNMKPVTIPLMHSMAILDLKTITEMYEKLEGKTSEEDKEMFNIFQAMLPVVGTRSSVLLIYKLIKEKKVDDGMAINMLQEMSFTLRMPSEKLLEELEDMICMKDVSPAVKNTAALSFATMVNKLHKNIITENNSLPDKSVIDRYVLKFVQHLKNSKDYSSQYIYMNALYNIGSVFHYLKPYITGEETDNHHLRYMAMCAAFSESTLTTSDEIYWTIFTDTSQHLELRVGAYFIIMNSMPSKTKLMDIYWVLKDDPCPELYHIHYSFLRSMIHTRSPIFKEFRTMAAEMLNFMRKPYYHTMSGFYMIDFEDPHFGFHGMDLLNMISTNTSKSFYYKFESDMYNIPIKDNAVWFKIDGIDFKMRRKLDRFLSNKDSSNYKEFIDMITSLKDQTNLHIEYAFLRNNKVISANYINCKTLGNLKTELGLSEGSDSFYITFKEMMQYILPNDLGMPAMLEVALYKKVKALLLSKYNMEDHSVAADLKYIEVAHLIYSLSFFNPIADIIQGVERVQAKEELISADFSLGMAKDKLKMTLNKMDDNSMDKFAMRNYRSSFVYVHKDLFDELKIGRNSSEHFIEVTTEDKNSKIMHEHHCPLTGLFYQIQIFDTKLHISKKTIMEFVHDLSQNYFKNFQTMPMGRIGTIIRHVLLYSGLSPHIGTLGFIIRVSPSEVFSVNHIDMSLDYKHEEVKDNKYHLPCSKTIMDMKYATKTKENEIIREIKMGVDVDEDPAPTYQNFKLNFTMICPNEKEFKICGIGTKKWIGTKRTGYFNMTMGYTDDPNTCPNTAGTVEINMKCTLSDEQQDLILKKLTYDECVPQHMHEPMMKNHQIDYNENIDCTMKHTSLRTTEYDVKLIDMPDTATDTIKSFLNFLKRMMDPYYSYEELKEQVETPKLIINYPLTEDEVNIELTSGTTKHIVTEAPKVFVQMFGLHTENYHYSHLAQFLYETGLTESCLIADEHIFNNNYEVTPITKGDWMQIVESQHDTPQEHSLDIFVKRMETNKRLGLKVKMDEKILEIIPGEEDYKITFNNKALAVERGSYHNEDIFSIGMLNDEHNTLIMHMYKYKFYIDCDPRQIRIDKDKMNTHMAGICFK